MSRINLYLETVKVGDSEVVRCNCGKIICSSKENYKEFVIRHDGALSDAGPERIYSGGYKGVERFVFRRFYCPQCLTLLESEVAPRESPVVRDYEPPG